jgi:hypothetical protein
MCLSYWAIGAFRYDEKGKEEKKLDIVLGPLRPRPSS